MDPLILPTRYEVLKRKAEDINADVARIIDRVPSAIERIQAVFREMHQTQVSRLEVLFAPSGTGKTTFLESLPLFFEDLDVIPVPPPDKCSLEESVSFIRNAAHVSDKNRVLIYFSGTGRDNPSESDEEFHRFFEHLRGLFRESDQLILVMWPVSQEATARKLYDLAREVGADSLLGSATTFFTFSGPRRDRYYKITDDTCRLMNSGHSLAEYGVDENIGDSLFTQASTIAEYFQKVIGLSEHLGESFVSVLKEKPRPRIWIILPGDDSQQIGATVSQLTSGSKRLLDIPAMITELAPARADSQYMKTWEKLGSHGPFLLRSLDVRVIELPPNLVLSIVRAYGSKELRELLKQKSGSKQQAIEQLRSSMLGELLLGLDPKPSRSPARTAETSADEFIRVQAAAKSNDQPLNAAVAAAIEDLTDGKKYSVGKKVEIYESLRPDIHLDDGSGEPICLEFTWRTTGRQVADINSGKQNTLTPGHIRPYVLAKVYDYVAALGLDRIPRADS
jgi:hypothetical protein